MSLYPYVLSCIYDCSKPTHVGCTFAVCTERNINNEFTLQMNDDFYDANGNYNLLFLIVMSLWS